MCCHSFVLTFALLHAHPTPSLLPLTVRHHHHASIEMKAVKPYVKQHMKLEPKEKLEEKS
jgi:hypothetical protein